MEGFGDIRGASSSVAGFLFQPQFLLTFRVRSFVVRAVPVHWRIFGITPGLYPLGLSSNFLPVVTVRNAQTLPSIPSRQNHPQAENRGSVVLQMRKHS